MKYDLLFYENPVAPEDIEAIARVAANVNLPIAAGERHANIYGVRELIEREIVDVIQPDTGRAGGLTQMKKAIGLGESQGARWRFMTLDKPIATTLHYTP